MKTLSVLGVVCLGVLSSATYAKAPQSLEVPHVPGEVVVKIKPHKMGKFLGKKSLLSAELKSTLELSSGNYAVLKSYSKSASSLAAELSGMEEVQYAEPNFIYKAIASVPTLESVLVGTISENQSSLAPNDNLYEKLWGMNNTGSNEPDRNGNPSNIPGIAGADINAEKAWEVTKGSKNVVIAIVDTGIDYNHPDLKNNIWVNEKEIPGNGIDDDGNGYIDDIHGWNAYKKNGDPMDGNSHGTHCAGTIGAQHNGIGVAGVMDEVTLMPVKFLSDSGSGSLDDAIVAIDYATKMNVDLMSNSWGGGGFSQALQDAISAAKQKGILFVAAAGNDGTNNDSAPHYPSNYEVENVVSVASHTAQDTLSSFSCFGKRTVHVAAPGSNILSSIPGEKYAVYSGTSMATPHVSGVLGLLISKEGRLPLSDVKERLMATTVPESAYRKTTISGGRVNAYNLLTDTRIPRQEPSDDAWRVEPLSEIFETAHPYANNSNTSNSYSFPGAKYIKVVIEKYDTESGYDFVIIKDGKGSVVEKVSGSGSNYETDYLETESFSIQFTSDSSEAKWGAIIKEVKVIY